MTTQILVICELANNLQPIKKKKFTTIQIKYIKITTKIEKNILQIFTKSRVNF